jgi:hypothetical protein
MGLFRSGGKGEHPVMLWATVLAAGVAALSAGFSFKQANDARKVAHVEQFRESLNAMAEMRIDLDSRDITTQNLSFVKLQLQAHEAKTLLEGYEEDVSPYELAFLAGHLVQLGQIQTAQRLYNRALNLEVDPADRLDILVGAGTADYLLADYDRGRHRFDNARELATAENFGSRSRRSM